MIKDVPINLLKPHPRNAEIYGDKEDVSALKVLIERNGFNPRFTLLVTQDYTVVSGHRRLQAAKAAGLKTVPCQIRTYNNDIDVLEDLLNENEQREKTAYQRTKEGMMYEIVLQERAKQKQVEAGSLGAEHGKKGGRGNKKPLEENFPQGVLEETKQKPKPKKQREPQVRDKAAEKVNMGSGKNYDTSKKVTEAIDAYKKQGKDLQAHLLYIALDSSVSGAKNMLKVIEKFTPEECKSFADSIDSGDLSVPKAIAKYNQRVNTEQRKEREKEEVKAKEAAPKIIPFDCLSVIDRIEDIDLLITDPPYFTDGDFTEHIAAYLRKVKPTGQAYVFAGADPNEVRAYLNMDSGHMKLVQMIVWNYNNTGQRQPNERYTSNYQVAFYFRGPDAPQINKPADGKEQYACQTINAPDARRNERYHKWQKPDELIRRLISNSSKPGDFVFDPFAGSGTHLVVGAKLGRTAKGCEVDPAAIEICKQRGCIDE